MRGRALVITCAVASAVVATLAVPASGATGAAQRPAAVTALAAFQKQGPVTLTWTNPRDIDRDVVRLARGPEAARDHQCGSRRDAGPPASHAGGVHPPRAGPAVLGRGLDEARGPAVAQRDH